MINVVLVFSIFNFFISKNSQGRKSVNGKNTYYLYSKFGITLHGIGILYQILPLVKFS
jgi:hypothetical protein